jgi:hypothetical protein
MGTRNLIVAQVGGEYKIAQYSQWDGYPSGQGVTVLNFLRSANVENLKKAVSECQWITGEEIESINTQIKTLPSGYDWKKDYPELSRDTGGDIFNIILFSGKRKLKNDIDFAKDSLFCEWAYVVDFDKNTFEIYQGFNQQPLNESDRFYSTDMDKNGYYPVRKIKEYDLSNLPDNETFIKECEGDEEDE